MLSWQINKPDDNDDGGFPAEKPNDIGGVWTTAVIVGAIFIGQIDRAGIITGLIQEGISVTGFKNLLLTEEFGLISLPTEYRKHVVSGMGIEV